MANEFLSRIPTSTGNRKVFTYSCWIKRNKISDWMRLLSITNSSNNDAIIQLTNVDKLRFRDEVTGPDIDYISSRRLRDVGSWMHLLVAIDTTAIQAEHRIRMYINGDSLIEHGLDTESMPGDRNLDLQFNSKLEHRFFARNNDSEYFFGESFDLFWVDGQALTPDVFGFNKDGDGYISVGSTQATDFRPGQWVPKSPRTIKSEINRRGGFGVNGFYLPMNDSSNFGADFHCAPDSIIKLKGEDLPQPRNGAPTTSDNYVSQLRSDPYAANLVLAVPGIDNNTNPELVTNGDFSNGTTGWTGLSGGSLSVEDGKLKITETTGAVDAYAVNGTAITTEVGKTYTIKWTFTEGTNTSFTIRFGNSGNQSLEYQSNGGGSGTFNHSGSYAYTFTATATQLNLSFIVNQASSYGYLSNVSVKEAVPIRDYSADIRGSGTNRTPTLYKCGVTSPVPSYYGSAIATGGGSDYLYYDLDGSGANAYGTGDFTFECWFFAIEEPSAWGILMQHATNGSWNNGITLCSKHNTTRKFTIYTQDGSSNVQIIGETVWALNQWHHVVAERYNGQITLYVNGVAEATRADTRNYAVAGTPASSAQYALSIGAQSDANYTSNGYFQDVRVYRGVAKYKGGFDVSKPYTPVGFEGGSWRQVPDTCKNNFCTLNPLVNSSTLSDGNLKAVTGGNNSRFWSTFAYPKTGKWYTEFSILEGDLSISFAVTPQQANTQYSNISDGIAGFLYYAPNGSSNKIMAASGTITAPTGWEGIKIVNGVATYGSVGEVVRVTVDQDNNTITITNHSGDFTFTTPSEINGENFHIGYSVTTTWPAATYIWNFGQNPTFSGTKSAGTYTDANGKGLFKYQPPSGALALCEDNLPTPAIADPGEHFKTVLYTGDGNGGRSITGVGFKPDFVWQKERNSTSWHNLVDSVRGSTLRLYSNDTSAEQSSPTSFTSFDSDGFSIGSDGGTNQSGINNVAWCWKAGGAAVSNSDGSINSSVSVNQTAGFSIVSFTSTSSGNFTIGHGLGKTPKLIITKERGASNNWHVWHSGVMTTSSQFLMLNSTAALGSYSNVWGTSIPTSLVFGANVGSLVNASTASIAYCWAEIEGFSKFGSYTGNGSTDGPFVYCGFKPAFVMTKRTDTTGEWWMYDSSRGSTNPNARMLLANDNGTENEDSASYLLDFLSNGFKIRAGLAALNGSGGSFIFMAFAESPFQTANAK